jgi:hypothetical protein
MNVPELSSELLRFEEVKFIVEESLDTDPDDISQLSTHLATRLNRDTDADRQQIADIINSCEQQNKLKMNDKLWLVVCSVWFLRAWTANMQLQMTDSVKIFVEMLGEKHSPEKLFRSLGRKLWKDEIVRLANELEGTTIVGLTTFREIEQAVLLVKPNRWYRFTRWLYNCVLVLVAIFLTGCLLGLLSSIWRIVST